MRVGADIDALWRAVAALRARVEKLENAQTGPAPCAHDFEYHESTGTAGVEIWWCRKCGAGYRIT